MGVGTPSNRLRRAARALLAMSGFTALVIGSPIHDVETTGPPPPLRAARTKPPLPAREPAPPRRPKPNCGAIRACLKRELPRYVPNEDAALIERATRCGGGTAAAAWEAAECFGVEIGRDPTTGLGVAVGVGCDDICPTYAHVFLRLSSELTARQCERLDGRPILSESWGGYVACEPPPPAGATPSPGKDFIVRTFDGNPKFRVSGSFGGTRVSRLGFHHGIGVTAIDGKLVEQANEVEALLHALPYRLPASVTLTDWLSSDHRVEGDVELHYPSCEAMRELARVIPLARLGGLTARAPLGPKRTSTIRVGDDSARYDPHCTSDEVTRLERVSGAIRRFARRTTARSVAPNASPECKNLDALPTDIEWSDGKRAIRLLYVDWMAR
jgi:hypothetical protein